jgi:hypothetical protein
MAVLDNPADTFSYQLYVSVAIELTYGYQVALLC